MKFIGKLLVIAGNLLVIGVIIASIGVVSAKKIGGHTRVEITLEEQEYVAKGSVDEIDVALTSEDVQIELFDGNEVTIKYYDSVDKPIYKLDESEGVLSIRKRNADSWKTDAHSFLDIAESMSTKETIVSGEKEVTIYVPESFDGIYSIGTISGKVDMEGVPDCKSIDVSTTSGNVSLMEFDIENDVEIGTLSGHVNIAEINCAGQVDISTTSGDVQVEKVVTAGELSLNTMSGMITGEDVSVESVACDSTSGDIRFKELFLKKRFDAGTMSGSVKLEINDSKDDYSVDASTMSGNISIEKGEDLKAKKGIDISTTSGAIEVKFSKQ